MEKKTFVVKLRLGDDSKFLDIRYGDEYFYLTFTEDDEWQEITTKAGEVYDVHLLREDKYEVEIYVVGITVSVDTGLLELKDTDCSEEGQQEVVIGC